LFSLTLDAQEKISINGKVLDSESKEPLIGVSILSQQTGKGALTDNFGRFSLPPVSKFDTLYFQYLGYNSKQLYGDSLEQQAKQVFLKAGINIDTVAVIAQKEEKAFGQSIGKIGLSPKQVKLLPAALGEPDAIKALSLMPGVSTGTEGTTGLFVRGGSPDQNLILLDDAVIYNGSHMLGFLSSFNTDVLKKVNLYKGYMPAEFGGRLSSVLDIRVKEGHKLKKQLGFSISPVNTKMIVELPLPNQQTSFMLAGRGSFVDLLTLPLYFRYKNGNADTYVSYQMYDINAKLHHIFSEDLHLSLSYFKTNDRFRSLTTSEAVNNFTAENKLNYGNEAVNLKLVHFINNRLYNNTSLVYSTYNSSIFTVGSGSDAVFANGTATSKIVNLGLKSNWTFNTIAANTLNFGLSTGIETFNPTKLEILSANGTFLKTTDLWQDEPKQSHNVALHASYTHLFGNTFQLKGGLRAWYYDIEKYNRIFIEPRLSLGVNVNSKSAVRLSYGLSNQTVHFLTNNGLSLPTDFWLPAIPEIPVSFSSQVSLGYSQSLNKNLDFEVDVYYKQMKRLIALKDGIDYYQPDRSIYEKLQGDGIGKAYGIEVSIMKPKGKLNGGLSYTYSRSLRQFNEINMGEWFPFKYDRPHDVSLFGIYHFNKKWTGSFTFIYNTGIAVTAPTAVYFPNNETGNLTFHFDERNNDRLNDYVRLDIGFTRTFKKSSLTLSIYNALGNFNPIYRELGQGFTDENPFDPYVISWEYGLFPFLPSINYSKKIF